MTKRIKLRVSMELLSDTIFGSGYSIPGGEDIAVYWDKKGYPYLKGSTFKGLLRESLKNWLVWTSGSYDELNVLMGESDWSAPIGERRINVTPLCLLNPPAEPDSCYINRTFTSLENGVVKQGTLRVASCIHSGLRFQGDMECAEDDVELISHALAGIKRVGTMRNRGFGHVRITSEIAPGKQGFPEISRASCIRYRLLAQSPILITNLNRSRGNAFESRAYIPGSAIRGMVASSLAETSPEVFETIRSVLLGSGTRFLDAVPVRGEQPPLPALIGFYEDKAETRFESVLKDGNVAPGLKRAKLGSFCSLSGDTLYFWSTAMSGSTRISLNHDEHDRTDMFQTRFIEPGELVEGFILLDDPSLASHICQVFQDTIWLGADRYSGFGKCSVQEITAMDELPWIREYGFHSQNEIGTDIYMLAVSPFTMLNSMGEPCGLDEAALARELGVSSIEVALCATSIAEFGGYNRIWKNRNPAVRMYERGSLFRLRCETPPSLEKLRSLEHSGIGIRRSEGFGQILFLPPALLDRLHRKEALKAEPSSNTSMLAAQRRNRLIWIMDHADSLNSSGLSRSQIGTLQARAEEARQNCDLRDLQTWLDKNLMERGEEHGARFKKLDAFLKEVLDSGTPLGNLGTPTLSERLTLLCMLCDYSRKVRKEDSEE